MKQKHILIAPLMAAALFGSALASAAEKATPPQPAGSPAVIVWECNKTITTIGAFRDSYDDRYGVEISNQGEYRQLAKPHMNAIALNAYLLNLPICVEFDSTTIKNIQIKK